MGKLLLFASLLIVRSAHAEDPDKAFQDFARREATEDKRYVAEWYTANLDADAALERVAVLCTPADASDPKGFFLIEKDATHRWELTFDVDSHTRACKGKPAAEPAFEQRKTKVIELYQAHLQGFESTSFALRVGQLVLAEAHQPRDCICQQTACRAKAG